MLPVIPDSSRSLWATGTSDTLSVRMMGCTSGVLLLMLSYLLGRLSLGMKACELYPHAICRFN